MIGLSLWWINFNARGLFLDEANLARNIAELNWTEFFKPLKYDQYAPPLYGILLKVLGESLGYSEWPLRLPSLIGGLATLVGLWMAGNKMGLAQWKLAALAFCFISPLVLRYVGELKPYALDMGLSSLLLAWALSKPKPRWWFAPIGFGLVWLSFPMVFSLASTLIYLLLTQKSDQRPWLVVGLFWFSGFLILYISLLSVESREANLQNFHSNYFFPWKLWTIDAWKSIIRLGLSPLKHGFGFTVLAQVVSGLAIVWALSTIKKIRWPILVLLLGPTLLAVGASVFGKYSLIPRLMLFSLPGLWLLACWGWQLQQKRISAYGKMLVPAVVLILIPSTNVIRHFRNPLQVGQVKNMLLSLPSDRPVFVDYWAIPAVKYYREINEPSIGPDVVYNYCDPPCPIELISPPYAVIFSMKTINRVNQRISSITSKIDTDSTLLEHSFFFRGQIIKADLR
ncbi:MAG: hypothetical protein AAGF87_03205 [Bacteroidota bacterium]